MSFIATFLLLKSEYPTKFMYQNAAYIDEENGNIKVKFKEDSSRPFNIFL